MRLIDADALKRKSQKVATVAWKMKIRAYVETVLNQFIDWIDAAPTIEPQRKTGNWECVPHKSVEHGEVVIDGDTVRCSNCRHAEKGWNAGMRYCPHCGTIMEGEQE